MLACDIRLPILDEHFLHPSVHFLTHIMWHDLCARYQNYTELLTQRKSLNEGLNWRHCLLQENLSGQRSMTYWIIFVTTRFTWNKAQSTLGCHQHRCISRHGIMIYLELVSFHDHTMFMNQWQKMVRTHPKYTNSNLTPSNVYDINHFYNWI